MKKMGGNIPVSKMETPTVSFNMIFAYIMVCGLTSFFLSTHVIVGCMLVLLLQMTKVIEQLDLRHQSAPYLLALWMMTIWLATTVGVRNYYINFATYAAVRDGQDYTGVDASDRTPAYMDAGKITFTNDSILNDNLAIGMGVLEGTFCAAPIMSKKASTQPSASGAASSDEMFTQFWAVGKDCCQSRSSFSCDDAASAEARGGVVLSNVMQEELKTLAHRSALHHDGYFKAVQAACALHGLTTSKVPILLHWTKNPDQALQKYYQWALLVWMLSSIVYGAIFTICWFLLEFTFDEEFQIDLEVSMTGKHRPPSPHKGMSARSITGPTPADLEQQFGASAVTATGIGVGRLIDSFHPKRNYQRRALSGRDFQAGDVAQTPQRHPQRPAWMSTPRS